jgi:uncharacterized protein (TIGR02117 family)
LTFIIGTRKTQNRNEALRKLTLAILKTLAGSFLIFSGTILLYLHCAIFCSFIPVHSNYQGTKNNEITIYILSNGVHLDLVLPEKNILKDWSEEVEPDVLIKEQVAYVAFGWGDKKFYLNTPEWSDLTLRTAFNALFRKGPSALHVSYFRTLEQDKNCLKIEVSEKQYCKLVQYIENTFLHDNRGCTKRIGNFSYERWDQFYEARGSYSPFFTCNTWVNKALRKSGLRSCLWTPFDKGIFWQYNKIADPSLL